MVCSCLWENTQKHKALECQTLWPSRGAPNTSKYLCVHRKPAWAGAHQHQVVIKWYHPQAEATLILWGFFSIRYIIARVSSLGSHATDLVSVLLIYTLMPKSNSGWKSIEVRIWWIQAKWLKCLVLLQPVSNLVNKVCYQASIMLGLGMRGGQNLLGNKSKRSPPRLALSQ